MKHSATLRALIVGAIAFALASCSPRKDGEPLIFTGKTYTQVDVRLAVGDRTACGSAQYAEVNDEWVAWAYDDFRSELSAGEYGVTKWDDRSKCTFFATSFEVFAQKRYFAQAFHSRIPAAGIAVGTIWYSPTRDTGHAINVILTGRGLRFFEPQTGKFVTLTADQIKSESFRKFD